MSKGQVAILVDNDYQDQEVWVPLKRLREEGYRTVVIGTEAGAYKRLAPPHLRHYIDPRCRYRFGPLGPPGGVWVAAP